MVNETVKRSGPSLARKLQLGAIALGAILVLIVIFQNTDPVETRLLLVTIEMPRALLLGVTLVIGFLLGLFTSISVMRKRSAARG